MENTIYDVIIIGAGPAGLTAALYASRGRMSALVIESYSVPSQLTMAHWIENYPGFPEGIGGFDLIGKLNGQARKFGALFITGDVLSISPEEHQAPPSYTVRTADAGYRSLSLILATGSRFKKLGIPGESAFLGRGVSYCAVCDAAFYKGKTVAVIGGGNSAAEEALYLAKFAGEVFLIHRRSRLRAAPILEERVLSEKKITVIWDSVAEEIRGTDKVEKLLLNNVRTGGKNETLCQGVFVAIGYAPNTDMAKDVVRINDGAYIITDRSGAASREGIFACGDCAEKKLRQAVTACGDGATAAFSCQEYVDRLKGKEYK